MTDRRMLFPNRAGESFGCNPLPADVTRRCKLVIGKHIVVPA